MDSLDPKTGLMLVFCKHGNEISDANQVGEFLD